MQTTRHTMPMTINRENGTSAYVSNYDIVRQASAGSFGFRDQNGPEIPRVELSVLTIVLTAKHLRTDRDIWK